MSNEEQVGNRGEEQETDRVPYIIFPDFTEDTNINIDTQIQIKRTAN